MVFLLWRQVQGIFKEPHLLFLKIFFMSLSCQPILSQFKKSQKISTVIPFPTLLIVFFGTKFRGRRIDLAKEKDGLYFLETPIYSNKVINNSSLSFLSFSNKYVICLHHCCLGHPSFRVLNAMFPSSYSVQRIRYYKISIVTFANLQNIPMCLFLLVTKEVLIFLIWSIVIFGGLP